MHELSHCVSVECAAPVGAALGFLADPEALAQWSLGCFGPFTEQAGVFRGNALDGAGPRYVRIDIDELRGEVQYAVGEDPAALLPRIRAIVIPGDHLGRSPQTCLVSLIAWRQADTTDASWRRTCAYHEAEILLIKGQLEARV